MTAVLVLLFRIIISVNQLSVYGAISDWCEELAQYLSDPHSTSTRILVAELNDESESRVAPNVVSILTNPLWINVPVQGDSLRRHNERFEHLPEDIRISKASEDAGFMRNVSRGQCFVTIHDIQLAGLG